MFSEKARAMGREKQAQLAREREFDTNEKIYQFLVDYTLEHMYPPTFREISAATGVSSISTVHKHLWALEEAGLITMEACAPRSIQLVGYKIVRDDGVKLPELEKPESEEDGLYPLKSDRVIIETDV